MCGLFHTAKAKATLDFYPPDIIYIGRNYKGPLHIFEIAIIN